MPQAKQDTKENLDLAIIQLNSNDSLKDNWRALWAVLKTLEANAKKVDLITFPENTLYLRIQKKQPPQFISLTDPQLLELNAWALEHKTQVHLGSVALSHEGQSHNATIWLGSSSRPEVAYKKIHLFDVQVGHQSLNESQDFLAGKWPAIRELWGWKVGLSICYDLRFPELFLYYAQREVDLILVPAAFLELTGEAHWHCLLRARAIESQCYVVAAAQCGEHRSAYESSSVRRSFGHSLAIHPWGNILCENKKPLPGVQYVSLKKEAILKFRAQIPMKSHRTLKLHFCERG